MIDKYKGYIGPEKTEYIFLSGNDCYALRCSYLHEGKSDISHQRIQEVIEDFEFVVPPEGGICHCNQSNQKLQLQVSIFCKDILKSIEDWLKNISGDVAKQEELSNILKISELHTNFIQIN